MNAPTITKSPAEAELFVYRNNPKRVIISWSFSNTVWYREYREFTREEFYDETKVIDEELRDYDSNGHLIRIFKGRFQKQSQKHFNKLAENDIFKLQQEFEERIDKCLFYKHNGQNVLIPGEVLSFIKTNVSAAFKVLDTLPHDKE